MRAHLFPAFLGAAFALCTQSCSQGPTPLEQGQLTNATTRNHAFLADMYADPYFPTTAVDKGKAILVDLCRRIESEKPDLDGFYELTHRATEAFNALQDDFAAQGSEIETGAREVIAMDFVVIAMAYGYDADVEEMIAPRDW